MIDIRNFPDWNTLYRDTDVKHLPWYSKQLDNDLEQELKLRNISNASILDLGTGPGTQAIQLSKLGFDVTATDISENAILKASKLSNKVKFIVDDILDSKLEKNSFDYVFDRGCFHTLSPKDRKIYIKNMKRILKDDGILFLKCFSIKEQEITQGPHRFSIQDIKEIFSNDFIIEKIEDTIFKGTLSPEPKALFIVMKKRL